MDKMEYVVRLAEEKTEMEMAEEKKELDVGMVEEMEKMVHVGLVEMGLAVGMV